MPGVPGGQVARRVSEGNQSDKHCVCNLLLDSDHLVPKSCDIDIISESINYSTVSLLSKGMYHCSR